MLEFELVHFCLERAQSEIEFANCSSGFFEGIFGSVCVQNNIVNNANALWITTERMLIFFDSFFHLSASLSVVVVDVDSE
jgi:hypothetical protein